MKRLLIGIPAYNERETIASVFHSLPKKIKNIDTIDVVLIDDGSTDETGQFARSLRIPVIRHMINRGLGGALKTIFAYARLRTYDYVVTIDADGQHKGEDISRLLLPLTENRSDVVIGSRWKGQLSAPRLRILVNKLANIATYLFFGIATSDSQSGLRAFNKKAIHGIHISADNMAVSSEFFREIYRHSLRYSEISIEPIYTTYSQQKGQKISNFPVVLFEMFLRFLRQ